MSGINIKRIYDEVQSSDGRRVLVDRLWPRGVSKAEADLDDWYKGLAPTDELREWFDHDPDRWDEFQNRYREELEKRKELCLDLLEQYGDDRLTLLYAARDRKHNNALVLKDYLEDLRSG